MLLYTFHTGNHERTHDNNGSTTESKGEATGEFLPVLSECAVQSEITCR